MNARWDRIKAIYFDAAALPEESRSAFLNEACQDDASIHEAVAELLQWGVDAPELDSPLRFKDLTGRTVGHYRVIEELGRGGMGVVYKAQDTFLGRIVVLKFLAPEMMANPEFRQRFMLEAKAAAAFDHPNICTLYGMEEDEGAAFLVMAYVGGTTLKERIQSAAMPVSDAVRIAAEAARGLREAHNKGVIHRDIKPSNILIADDGRVVITDFGLAQVNGEARITRHGEWMGTPAYMSPEQIRGAKASPASDIWSLGVVLYEMISRRLPFPDTSMPALLLAIQEGAIEQLPETRTDLPPGLANVLARMLQRDEADRFPDGGAVYDELERLAGVPVVREAPARSASRRSPRRGFRWGIGIAAAALAAAGAGLAVLIWSLGGAESIERAAVIPLSSYSGVENGASFSPDGQQVAFSWFAEGATDSEICIKMITDEKSRCLTSNPLSDFAPAWSPDGRWIAFLRGGKTQTLALYVISPLGGQERQLTEIISRDGRLAFSRAAWTPDSSALVFSDFDPEYRRFRLWRLAIDTLNREPLTTPPEDSEGDRSPSVSLDGRSLAFVRDGEISGDIWVQPLTAEYHPEGAPRQVTFDGVFVGDPVFTADGQDLVYPSSEALTESGMRLWRTSASGVGKPQPIELAAEGSFAPAISRDGRRLAFTKFQNDQNIWRIDRDVETAAWQPARKFSEVSSTRDDAYLTPSPDGRRVAFVSNRGGGFDIWVSNSDGSNAQQRTSFGAMSGTMAWSPDNAQLAFDRNVNGNWDVYLVNADAGPVRRLTLDATNETVDTWSHDGKSLYINSTRTEIPQIWRIPADGGEAVQVTPNGGYFALESPDQKYLYYSITPRTGPLRRLTLATGEDIEVLPAVLPLSFAVTRSGIFFMTGERRTNRSSEIRFLNFLNGREEIVAAPEGIVLSDFISVSPDERTVFFTQRDQLGSDLMVVNNFS